MNNLEKRKGKVHEVTEAFLEEMKKNEQWKTQCCPGFRYKYTGLRLLIR